GVEVAGALNDFVRQSAKYYPEVNEAQIRMMLIEAGPRLMPEMTEKLASFAERVLGQRGVEVLTNTAVTRVDRDGFDISTGEHISTDTLIWAAGLSVNPLIASLDLPKDPRGRLRVNEYLEVEGGLNLWSLGDCANVPNPQTGKPHPQTAQHALREAKIAARNIAAGLGVGTRRPFVYRTMGQLALVGERTGVADVMGLRFSGMFAWFLWR